MAEQPLLLRVWVPMISLQKAVRFPPDTTVRQATQVVAEKCNLIDDGDTDESSRYALFVPNEAGGVYLLSTGCLLRNFGGKDGDTVELHYKPTPVRVIGLSGESSERLLDFESPANEMLVRLCKVEECAVDEVSLFVQENPERAIKLNASLGDQDVTEKSVLILRAKKSLKVKRRDSKKIQRTLSSSSPPSSVSISEPMFVKSTRSEFDDDDVERENGSPIFGMPLSVGLMKGGKKVHAVCPLVTNAVDWIAKNALHVEGIFRISPKSQELEKLKQSMDSTVLLCTEAPDAGSAEISPDFDRLDEARDSPHLVCGILKLYLRELPQPVIPYKMYDLFMMVADSFQEDEDMDLQDLVVGLPTESRMLLKRLLGLLESIAARSQENKMSPMNLATVFGPNILRMEDETDMMKIVRDSPKVNRIMVYLITHATSVFGVQPPAPPSNPKPSHRQFRRAISSGNVGAAMGVTKDKDKPRSRSGGNVSGAISPRAGSLPQPLDLPSADIPLCSSAPLSTGSEKGVTVKALHNYEASCEKEISFEAGDAITVVRECINGWWRGRTASGSEGFFPAVLCGEPEDEDLSITPRRRAKEKRKSARRSEIFSDSSGASGASKSPFDRISELEDLVKMMTKDMKRMKKQLKDEQQLREEMLARIVALEKSAAET